MKRSTAQAALFFSHAEPSSAYLSIQLFAAAGAETAVPSDIDPGGKVDEDENDLAPAGETQDGPAQTKKYVRWPSEGSLLIENVSLCDQDDQEQIYFQVGLPMMVKMDIQARRTGKFNLVVAATLFRMDGILITNFISDPIMVEYQHGEIKTAILKIQALNLGDGGYTFSASIFEDRVDGETRYDLIDRAFQFKVLGNTIHGDVIFSHPGDWELINMIEER